MLAKSLARILYEALHNEIGWNQSKVEGLASLGMRARKVELVHPPTFALFWKEVTIQTKSVLMMGQQTL